MTCTVLPALLQKEKSMPHRSEVVMGQDHMAVACVFMPLPDPQTTE
jgi:hypothetical protein